MKKRLSIAEIIEGTIARHKKEAKVEFLREHDSKTLRDILVLTYSPGVWTFNIPNEAPLYRPSDLPDAQGIIHREVRKLKYFVNETGAGANLDQYRRETMFRNMLESVDKGDAQVLCHMLTQKPFKGLTREVLKMAFGGDIPDLPEPAGEQKPAEADPVEADPVEPDAVGADAAGAENPAEPETAESGAENPSEETGADAETPEAPEEQK